MIDRVGQQFGNYQLVKLLGRGGCAEVYLGKHRYLNSYAALKVSKATIHPRDERTFLAEAQRLVDLRHSHIIHLLDFNIENGIPVLIMDYAPQGSLRQYYPGGTQMPLATVVDCVTQIAAALQYAHNHNVIHCDVKPENILLDANDHLLLSDFGISLLTPPSEQLSTQDPVGTPRYIAPEQLRGKPCFASDQYALAIMVYEWLCGKLPFSGTMWEISQQHMYATPPPLRATRPDLPLRLETIVLRALAKRPQDRFVSIQAFARSLAQASQTDTSVGGNDSQVTAPLQPIPRSSSIAGPHHVTTLSPQERQIALIPTRPPVPVMPKLPPALALQHQNHMRLLQRVRSFWITGVLEQSLHGAALLALGLQERPDAVANPWQLIIQESEHATTPLPTGTRITEVYDGAHGELLILGEPGAGKTTLLLELARDLLNRAEQEPAHPVPVVFNLSSWAQKRQPLVAWLIEELETKYQVPRKLGSGWVNADQILPLLDGLDEVDASVRTTCMRAINEYHQAHSLVPLVVCCRVNEYMSQVNRLALYRAVTIQPLTAEQVNEYLARVGEKVASLHIVFQSDPVLQELATTPLMLTILILTYQGTSVEEIRGDASAEVRQRQIFALYTQRMLRRRNAKSRYGPQQTIRWLSYLAQQMKRQSQTVFYIEQMQPDWLPGERIQRIYTYLGVRLPGILMGILVSLALNFYILFAFLGPNIGAGIISLGLVGGLLGALLSRKHAVPVVTTGMMSARKGFRRGLIISGVAALGTGVVMGVGVVLIMTLYTGLDALNANVVFGDLVGLETVLLTLFMRPGIIAQPSNRITGTSQKTRWYAFLHSQHAKSGWLVGSIIGLGLVLYVGLGIILFGLMQGGLDSVLSHMRSILPIISVYIVGLILVELIFICAPFGLTAALVSLILADRSGAVQPIERLAWSWKSLWRSLINTKHLKNVLYLGLIVVLLCIVLIVWSLLTPLILSSSSPLPPEPDFAVGILISVLSVVLSITATYWVLFGLIRGVTGEQLDEQHRIVPNHAIHRSARNGLLFGFVGGTVCLLVCSLGVLLFFVLIIGLANGLQIGPPSSRPTFSVQGISLGFLLPPVLVFIIASGLLIGLLTGWLACMRHYTLRWLLWRTGSIPGNYARFLNYAAERILLRKAGGGYIFVHRLLLDYFASLDPPITNIALATNNSQLVISRDTRIDTARREENTSYSASRRKTVFNKEKRISLLFVVVVLLLAQAIGASIFWIALWPSIH